MHTSHDHTQREGENPAEGIQWLLICIKLVCVCGTIQYYYTAELHVQATDALGCVAWFTTHWKPHWCWLLRVCGLTPAFPHRDLDTHSASSFRWGQESSILRQTACIFSSLPSLPVSILPYPSFFVIYFLNSLVYSNWETHMDVWIVFQTYMSIRNAWVDVRQASETTTFRSLTQSVCQFN